MLLTGNCYSLSLYLHDRGRQEFLLSDNSPGLSGHFLPPPIFNGKIFSLSFQAQNGRMNPAKLCVGFTKRSTIKWGCCWWKWGYSEERGGFQLSHIPSTQSSKEISSYEFSQQMLVVLPRCCFAFLWKLNEYDEAFFSVFQKDGCSFWENTGFPIFIHGN